MAKTIGSSGFPTFTLKGDPRRPDLIVPTSIEKPKPEHAPLDYFQVIALMGSIVALVLRTPYAAWAAFMACLLSYSRRKVSESDGSNAAQTWLFSAMGLVMAYANEISNLPKT